jgi:hypothetical protein
MMEGILEITGCVILRGTADIFIFGDNTVETFCSLNLLKYSETGCFRPVQFLLAHNSKSRI